MGESLTITFTSQHMELDLVLVSLWRDQTQKIGFVKVALKWTWRF